MSDRYHSLTVTLERDIRDDDARPLIQSILMLRGVIKVVPRVADMESHMAEARARHELGQKLLEVIYPKSTE